MHLVAVPDMRLPIPVQNSTAFSLGRLGRCKRRLSHICSAAKIMDAGQSSSAVIHGRYREFVKPADAERWFNVTPETVANVLALPSAIASIC
jgi:hypothetical protein